MSLIRASDLPDRISFIGVPAADLKFAEFNRLAPRGSAVLTSSGKLADSGILAVIHAAPGSSGAFAVEPTLESVALSTLNSIQLAEKNGHKKVAIPFIGGRIFAGRIGAKPEQIARSIVEAALKANSKIEIVFVLFGHSDFQTFNTILESLPDSDAKKRMSAVDGSITDFKVHGASAIVNAANVEVQFGGGVSGAIGNASGRASEINSEAQQILRLYSDGKPLERALKEGQISYKTFGNPKNPALLLVHGLDSAGITFSPITQDLAKDFYVISVDQRGHGESADPDDDYRLSTLAGDLKALMTRLGIEKFHILGHSFGARTALRLASLWPESISSFVVEDMSFSGGSHDKTEDVIAEADEVKAEIPLEYNSRAELIRALTKFYDGDKKQAESIATRRAKEIEGGKWKLLFRPHVSILYGHYAGREDQGDEFAQVSVPTLLIYPDKNGAVNKSKAADLQTLKPDTQVAEIPRSAHNVHGSNTPDFLAALRAFYNKNQIIRP